MKVLFLGHEVPPVSGVSVATYHTVKALSKIGVDATLFTYKNSGSDPFVKKYWTLNLGKLQELGILFAAPQMLFKKADIFHADYFSTGAALGLAMKKPLVVTLHDIIPFHTNEFSKKNIAYYKWGVGIVKGAAQRILVDSKNSAREAVEIAGLPEEKVDFVYDAVDPEVFFPDKSVAKKSKVPTILYSGGYGRRKNVLSLILAAKKILSKDKKAFRLKLVGNVPDSILAEIRNANLPKGAVELTGFVSVEELRRAYSSADLFVFPSIAEGFGLPPLEAMACGCPVLSSGKSCLTEILGNAAGFVEPTPNGIAEGIENLLSSERKRKDLSLKGLAQAKKYSWEKSARKLLSIYRELVV